MVAGQNMPLQSRNLRFVASSELALDVSALLVDGQLKALSSDEFVFYNQPETGGVALESDALRIELDKVGAAAHAVLCIVSVDPASVAGKSLAGVTASLLDEGRSAVAVFDIPLRGGETAVICFELYRRGADWKVRAIGQGYSGGLEQLITTHGVEVDDPAPAAETTPAAASTLSLPHASPAAVPLDRARAYERMWMIFEDAARSAAAFVSASDYAESRLDAELSAAIADPATRNTPAGSAARDAAHSRHDELIATAQRTFDTDSEHLVHELQAIDPELPRSLASWDSPAWQAGTATADPTDGIRLGELTGPERGPLRIPFCVRLPLTRPLWVSGESSSAATPVVASLVARIVSATAPTPTLEVVDLTASLDMLTMSLSRLLGGPVVRSHTDISARLESITNALELAEMAAASGMADLRPPDRVVVLSDFPHGYQEVDIARIMALATANPSSGLSLIIIGSDESRSEEPQLAALARHCQLLPVGAELEILDPWTHNEWTFTPDAIPADADRLAKVMGLLDRL